MKFSEAFPDGFFSVLNSPIRETYVDALLVLYQAMNKNPRFSKEDAAIVLVYSLENQLANLEDDEMEVTEREELNLSARAHYILRKLVQTGWLEIEPDYKNSFQDYYIMPDYASRILAVLDAILSEKRTDYNGFVFATYSLLYTSTQQKKDYYLALKQAYDFTNQLWKIILEFLHNIRRYHKQLYRQEKISDILQAHFDSFIPLFANKIYHPIKTSESIPRFKPRIIGILNEWLHNDEILEDLILYASVNEDISVEEAYDKVRQIIDYIIDTYERLDGNDGLVKQVDMKHDAYTRASVEKMRFYLNSDQDIAGQLTAIFKKLPSLESKIDIDVVRMIQAGLPISTVRLLNGSSLYTEPKKRPIHEPEEIQIKILENAEIKDAFIAFAKNIPLSYSNEEIYGFIGQQMGERPVIKAQDLLIKTHEDFIKLILATVRSANKDAPYEVLFGEGRVELPHYVLPDLTIQLKEAVVRPGMNRMIV